jgi:molybdate transport system substrate-binding protein
MAGGGDSKAPRVRLYGDEVMIRAPVIAAILYCASAFQNSAVASEIRILSSKVMKVVFSELLPQFEMASGNTVAISYGKVGTLAARLRRGDATDILILSERMAEELRKRTKLAGGREKAIAQVGIGVFVRKGEPRPDLSSLGAFLQSVTGGKMDFGLNPIRKILVDPEVELVGPLPMEIQKYTRYVAYLLEGSRQEDEFNDIIAFLHSSAAAEVMKKRGFESL